MPMYNLVEYSDNHCDTSGTLWQFKRDELSMDVINPNITIVNSTLFKYKSSLLKGSTVVDANRVFKSIKIAVPLRHLSNIFRSLEMPLINCKIHIELNWTENCVISDDNDETTFKITNCYFIN